jgi:hypothetical protein
MGQPQTPTTILSQLLGNINDTSSQNKNGNTNTIADPNELGNTNNPTKINDRANHS